MVQTGNYDFTFGREAIAVVSEYKYLGITFNYNGKLRKGELELVEQAKRAMCSLVSKLDLPAHIQIDIYIIAWLCQLLFMLLRYCCS